jgi:hypothetical protein
MPACRQYGYVAGGSTDGAGSACSSNIYRIDFTNDLASLVGSATLYQACQDLHGISGATTQGYFSGGASTALANRTNIFDYASETAKTLQSNDLKKSEGFGITNGAYRGYVAGGATTYSGLGVKDTTRIVFSNNTVTAMTSLKLQNAVTGLTGSDGSTLKGYFVGGYDGSLVTTIERLDYTTESYESVSGILSPARQYAAGCSGTESKGYLCGGLSSGYSTYTSILVHYSGIVNVRASADLAVGIQRAAGLTNRESRGYLVGGESSGGIGGITLGSLNILVFALDASYAATTFLPSGHIRQGMAAISSLCRPLGGPGGFAAGGSYGYDGIISSYSKKTDKIVFRFDTTVAVTSADLKLSPSRRDSTAGVSGNSYRGYWAGGYADKFVSVIDKIYYSIERTAASCPVSLTDGTHGACGVSQGDYKGFISGGYRKSGTVTTNKTFKITYASPETLSAVATANLYEPISYMGSISNNLYKGYFAGGINEVVRYGSVQVINYSTNTLFLLASKNLTRVVSELAGMDADNTKGYFAGGDTSPYNSSSTIDKFDFATDTITATTTSTNNLSTARTGLAAVSERVTKGYFMGGSSGVLMDLPTCDKITFATDSVAALEAGNLTQSRTYVAGVSPVVKLDMAPIGAYFTGGYTGNLPTVLTEKIVYEDDVCFYLASANIKIRRAGGAGISDEGYYGYVCSGNIATFDTTVLTNTFEYIDYSTDISGSIGTAIGQSRMAMAGCTGSDINGYFAGGQTNIYSTRVDKFSYETNTCNQLSSQTLTPGRAYAASVSDGYNYGYFAGGVSSSSVQTVNKIQFANDIVSQLTSVVLNAGNRWGLAGCDGDNVQGIFAGGNLTGSLTKITEFLYYDTGTTSTVTTPLLSSARYNLAAATNGSSHGYFSGGATDSYNVKALVNTTDKIYFAGELISQIGSAGLAKPRSGCIGLSGYRNVYPPPKCGEVQSSRGNAYDVRTFGLDIDQGYVDFTFDAFNSPDKFVVSSLESDVVYYDSGWRGTTTSGCPSYVAPTTPTNATFTFEKPYGVKRIKVEAYSPCGAVGWEYTLSCLTTNVYVAGTFKSNYGRNELVPYGNYGIFLDLAPNLFAATFSVPEDGYHYGLKTDKELWYSEYGSTATDRWDFFDDPDWTSISKGAAHFAGVFSNSTASSSSYLLYVIGDNKYGQLGLGDNNRRDELEWTGLSPNTVVCGPYTTFVIQAGGLMKAAGRNIFGELGTGDTYDRNTFTTVEPSVAMVSAGNEQTFIIKTDGKLYVTGKSMGLGTLYQLVSEFTQVGSATTWKTVSTSGNHTMAIKTNGTLWAIGLNTSGELGLGDNTNRSAFVQVGTDNTWEQVSCNGSRSYALKQNKSLWVMGDKIGIGTGNTNVPIQMGTKRYSKVFGGLEGVFALRLKGEVPPVNVSPCSSSSVIVIQICNSNSIPDYDMDVYLNDTKIGFFYGNTTTQAGTVFISSPGKIIAQPDFICPLANMTYTYFSSSIINFNGTNKLELKLVKDNGSGGGGSVEIRAYTSDGNNLVNPTFIKNLGLSLGLQYFDLKCPDKSDLPPAPSPVPALTMNAFDSEAILTGNQPPINFEQALMSKESVEQIDGDRKNICRHASKMPLQMVNSYHGQVAIRRCDIYGFCCHTSVLQDRPEVFCCQSCPDYHEDENNKQFIILRDGKELNISLTDVNPQPQNNQSFYKEIEYKNINLSSDINKSSIEIEYKDINEISDSNLRDVGGFKIKSKDDVQPDVNELLGE